MGNTVNLYWIPSHVGISGSESADNMAKTECQKEDIDIVCLLDK